MSESYASLRDQLTIVLALRKGPRARSGLAKALKDAGNSLVRPSDDRSVVFALEALARKGYVIRDRADARGRCRLYLDAEPVGSAMPDASLNSWDEIREAQKDFEREMLIGLFHLERLKRIAETCPGCDGRRKRTDALCFDCRMGLAHD